MRTSSRARSAQSVQSIEKSGNSHVVVYVDTTGIAFAMLYTLLASGQINVHQFREALRILSQLNENRISVHPERTPQTFQVGPNPLGPPSA